MQATLRLEALDQQIYVVLHRWRGALRISKLAREGPKKVQRGGAVVMTHDGRQLEPAHQDHRMSLAKHLL